MNKFAASFSLALVALGVGCSLSQQAQSRVQRQPMEKPSPYEYKTPKSYQPRERGYDPKTGEPVTYDHKPRVEIVDAKAGKYALKWIGFDGRDRMATFYRIDAVDVVVSASVINLSPKMYQYTYEATNLRSSGTYLKFFIVQTFSTDIKPAYAGQFVHLTMSRNIKGFEKGTWIDFSDVSDHVQIDPGQSVTIQFTSPDPPGLVECRAGAESIVDGSDEDVPADLYSLLRGYDEYLHGWTIGPTNELKYLSAAEKAKYLLQRLPQFRKVGWMTEQAFRQYDEDLKNGNLNPILSRIDEDLKTEQITSEVLAILQAMK
jgi:hypothetical protein